MKVKSVEVDDFYKNKYVQVGSLILSIDNAHEEFPKLKKAILKAKDNKLKASFPAEKIEYKPFPPMEKMVSDLLAQRKRIYRHLKHEHKHFLFESQGDQSKRLYDYLSQHLTYDMTSREDVEDGFKKLEDIETRLNELLDQYIVLDAEYENNPSHENAKKLQHLLEELDEVGSTKNIDAAHNELFLKVLYNSLIYKKSVCSGMAYAYAFLLDGLNIANYMVATKRIDCENSHIFNLVQAKDVEKKLENIVVDQTIAARYKNTKKQEWGFDIDGQNYLKGNKYYIYRVEKLSPLTNNPTLHINQNQSDKIKVKNLIKEVFGHEIDNGYNQDIIEPLEEATQ